MKKYLLLSIQPKYIKEIEAGFKVFEFRKKIPNFNSEISENILLYCSKPEMKIIGRIKLREYYTASFDELMVIVNASDDYKIRISNYFKDSVRCHAIKIDDYIRYENPIHLTELRMLEPKFVPGQSYRFLSKDSEIVKKLESLNGTL